MNCSFYMFHVLIYVEALNVTGPGSDTLFTDDEDENTPYEDARSDQTPENRGTQVSGASQTQPSQTPQSQTQQSQPLESQTTDGINSQRVDEGADANDTEDEVFNPRSAGDAF